MMGKNLTKFVSAISQILTKKGNVLNKNLKKNLIDFYLTSCTKLSNLALIHTFDYCTIFPGFLARTVGCVFLWVGTKKLVLGGEVMFFKIYNILPAKEWKNCVIQKKSVPLRYPYHNILLAKKWELLLISWIVL